MFTDVTSEAGLGEFRHETGAEGNFWMPETLGGGAAFLDYDNDGHLDILLVRGSRWVDGDTMPALALYRNEGAGQFVDRTADSGLDEISGYLFGPIVADYDNDGDPDVYVTSLTNNLLLRNDEGVFVDVAAEVGVAGPAEWSTAAVFFDADLDGWLDLFVGNYVEWSPETDIPCSLVEGSRSYCTPHLYNGLPGRFYRNQGDGSFREISESAGFDRSAPGKTLAATSIDFDGDGHPDLVVVNDTERDLLYRNHGDGTFEEVGILSGIALDRFGNARAGMGVDFGVMDSTGRPTVFVANFSREMVGAYRYSRGRFVDRAPQAGIGQPSLNVLSFGLFVFDADLDGHLDLFIANGHISPDVYLVDAAVPYRQPVQLYLNSGEGSFALVAAERGEALASAMVARAATFGDIDGDGDQDVLIVENGGPAHLWRNEIAGRNFVRVELEGVESNRDGIGARVELIAGTHRAVQELHSGASYLSSFEQVLTFGLGGHTMVDSLIVKWPSGTVDALGPLPANRQVRVIEGRGLQDEAEGASRTGIAEAL